MKKGVEASLIIILAGRVLLVKTLITLEPHGIFGSNFEYLSILIDEASQSIILAGRALLVTILITLEPHGIFGSNFVYLCIFTLSSHWYEKM